VDAPLLTPHELVRPWQRATAVAAAIAAIEFVFLLGGGVYLLAKPISHALRREAVASVKAPPSKQPRQATRRPTAPPVKTRPRDQVKIMVFNGNGVNGAAGSTAAHLHGLGYRIAGTANAGRQDYASSVVMYRPGFRAEGLRLAHELGVKVVGPLDGIGTGALRGGELAVIVGA
jgi:hypothetical protein